MARKFAAHWVFTHSYTCKIVLIDFSGGFLLVAKILEGLPKIKGNLFRLDCRNEFGFGSRQREEEGKEDVQRDRSAVHHEDVAGV